MKHFIIVGKTCQSKNKVQKLILEHLQKLDQTLWASLEQASEASKNAYENALKEYTGKASIPEFRSFVPQNHQLTLFVEDLIYVNIYAVKKIQAMILGFSTKINGKPTHFVEKIWKALKESLSSELYYKMVEEVSASEMTTPYEVDIEIYNEVNPKLTTIREDKNDRWKSGKIIDFFINVRQKNMRRFAPKITVVSTQKIFMTYYHSDIIQISVDGRELFSYTERLELAINDGFDNWEDFFNYFYPKIQDSVDKSFKGKIIHWTDLRY